jgi:hypothetical protein
LSPQNIRPAPVVRCTTSLYHSATHRSHAAPDAYELRVPRTERVAHRASRDARPRAKAGPLIVPGRRRSPASVAARSLLHRLAEQERDGAPGMLLPTFQTSNVRGWIERDRPCCK